MLATTVRMPRKSKDPTAPLRIKADLAHMIGTICSEFSISAADLVDPVLRPFIIEKHKEAAKSIAARAAEHSNGKRRRAE